MNKWMKSWIWWATGTGISILGTILWLQTGGTNESLTWFADMMTKALTIFLVYLAGSILVSERVWNSWYLLWEVVQEVYLNVGNMAELHLIGKISKKMRERLQRICFLLLFLLMIVMDVKSSARYGNVGRYWALAYGILLFLIAFFSVEEKLEKQNWNGKITMLYTVFWGMTCVSDAIVRKTFSFTGYVMLLAAGFVFFVWQNQHQTDMMLRKILRGLEDTLPFIVLYCVCFRPIKDGGGYHGCFTNREGMALYAVALVAAFLAELYNDEKGRDVCRSICGLAVSWYFLIAAGKKGCIVIGAALTGCMLLMYICKNKKIDLTFILLSTLIAAILIGGLHIGLQKLPQKVGHPVTYEREQETSITEDKWNRQELWSAYGTEWNVMGHKNALKFDGKRENASNGIMQVGYRYGILILIPYIMLLYQAYREAIKKRDVVSVMIMSVFLATMMLYNVEIPFTTPIWLMFYIFIGKEFENK